MYTCNVLVNMAVVTVESFAKRVKAHHFCSGDALLNIVLQSAIQVWLLCADCAENNASGHVILLSCMLLIHTKI